jgi:DUF1680 family protein
MTNTLVRDEWAPVRGTTLNADSFLGARVAGNLKRLQTYPLDPLLAPYEHRPGAHPWIGEHIGKWMHAAATTWQDTRDPILTDRLAMAAARLVATQEPDGYLGTYEPGKRLGNYPQADWDVWSHKYCMIGLLAHHQTSGDDAALAACVRAADLLNETFGDEPGKRSIVAGAWHMGMAPSSVLEPIAVVYRSTGDQRILGFAHYILRAWDEPQTGPRVRSTLLASGKVSEVGNGKAYEMLSCLNGLVELYRVTGDAGHLTAVRAAWDDIVAHHLYVTGTASFGEHFHQPDELPDSVSVNMGETCVTVTWLQLTRHLFGLTGEARYAEELERTMFNHLSAAQRPDGLGWSYYTPLHGNREYSGGISCCISSGPRGMALVPSSVLWTRGDELAVGLYVPCTSAVELGGSLARVRLDTGVPHDGGAVLTFEDPVTCALRFRAPAWAPRLAVDGRSAHGDGWVHVPARAYEAGDQVHVRFDAGLRWIAGHGWNRGRGALARGPLVLAHELDGQVPARFEPFATAADRDRRCRVWVPAETEAREVSAFHRATESQSSGEPGRASFNDGDPWSYAATEDDDLAWFGLRAEQPVTFSRVVYVHGRCLVHGGWFDTTAGKPVIQVLADPDGEWLDVGSLDNYPDTTAALDAGLPAGSRFELVLPQPVTAVGLRVTGPGAWGQWPDKRFVTCALLEAF